MCISAGQAVCKGTINKIPTKTGSNVYRFKSRSHIVSLPGVLRAVSGAEICVFSLAAIYVCVLCTAQA